MLETSRSSLDKLLTSVVLKTIIRFIQAASRLQWLSQHDTTTNFGKTTTSNYLNMTKLLDTLALNSTLDKKKKERTLWFEVGSMFQMNKQVTI